VGLSVKTKEQVKYYKLIKGQNKIKIYKDEQGNNKGDAVVSFLRPESVTLAVDMINGTEIRPGYKITVEPAVFQQKGDYQQRKAQKIDDLQKFKNKAELNRMLGWNEEEDEKGLKIIILQNMFAPSDFYVIYLYV
jgi:hypothetical protein